MTVDEELKQLEDNIRKLKIEYDIFFGGGSKRPPNDLDWRVQSILKKYSDSQRLTFAQRFRFNTIQQKYAIYSDLWRKKVHIKEEGFRRPADAILSIQGIRSVSVEDQPPKKQPQAVKPDWEPLKVKIGDPNIERDTVRTLFDALTTARLQTHDATGPATFDSFANFVQKKTTEIRSHYKCDAVEYEVELAAGKVKLKARPKK